MQNFDFDKVTYHRFRDFENEFYIEELIGFDTEAYTSGKPFLFCDSRGRSYKPETFFHELFTSGEKRLDFATWNLKYDAGAVLYCLPLKAKQQLWKDEETTWEGMRFEYLPHKLLRVKLGKMVRNFWDVMPFYGSSLDSAARTYLHDQKDQLPTKKFTHESVRRDMAKITAYCIKDAQLTARLGNYLLKYLQKFKIYPRTLYSTASISFQYFRQNCEYVHVWRFWKKYKELLRFACEAYSGGKFEVTARGSFTGFEYDISSAYGSEIAKLENIQYGFVSYSKKFESRSDYGFMRVRIDNREGKPIPCTYKQGNLNLYPAGVFHSTITKNEYIYLRDHGIPCDIKEGWWIKLDHHERPYEKEVLKLYKIKEEFKTKDKMVSKLAKTMINSFYGKFVQVNEENDGTLSAGIGWNPIYGAIITANMRIRLTELQAKLGKRCIGVHTDSIITTSEMESDFLSDGLGGWTQKEMGEGVIIACGIFQIGSKNANRGFNLSGGHTWKNLLAKAGNRLTVDMRETRVLSWGGQVSRGKDKDINLFTTLKKRLDLSCETKRSWGARTTASDLLKGLEYSAPPIVMESE